MRVRLAVAGLASALGACALITNLDDLGGTPTDASIDDGGVDGTAATFCASNAGHTFCEDFDNPNWPTNVSISAGPDGSMLSDVAVSPPHSMALAVGGHLATPPAMVTKTFTFGSARVATIDVWLRLELPPGLNYTDTILQLVLTPEPPNLTGYALGINQQVPENDTVGFVKGNTVDAGGVTSTTPALSANVIATWRHFVVKLDRAAHTVTFNGVSLALLSDAGIDSFQMQLGLPYAFSDVEVALVDDILVDLGDGG